MIELPITGAATTAAAPGRGKALMVFPPQWSPQNPHYSMRAIMGHLRAHGVTVAVRDLNVEYYDAVLTADQLYRAGQRAKLAHDYLGTLTHMRALAKDRSLQTRVDAMRYGAIDRYFKEKGGMLEQLPRLIQDAKETLRDPRRFYNPDMLVEAFKVIDEALELISLPYFPARFTFNYFEQPDCLMTIHSLIKQASDRKNNLFYDFFAEQLASLLAEEADYIGISINAFSQVVPGLTLAHLLRQHLPATTHLSIGGNFFARVTDSLKTRPDFFQAFCDSLASGEGEQQTLLIVQAILAGADLATVPNLLYLEDGQVRSTDLKKPPRMSEIAIQDLAGLPMDKYFTPTPVLTIQASKGCYWGKCSFCDSYYGVRVDQKSLDHLIHEIRTLKEQYGIRHFQFIDEAIPPPYMKRMAQRFLDEGLDIEWFSNGRLESSFTPELMALLHESGLRMVLWGFESGSPRILELINKGVEHGERLEILRGSSDAGIWNFAYIFFGFPTETREEAQMTIDTICQHQDIIHSYGRSVFTMGKQSPLYRDAAKYGIVDIVEDVEELSTNLHYRTDTGMDDKQLDEALKACTTYCGAAYDYALWFFLRYRENIHLYVSQYGLDYVRNYKMTRYIIPDTCEEVY